MTGENPKSLAGSVSRNAAGEWIVVGPGWKWVMVPAGDITPAEKKVICEQVVSALWGEETPEEAFWRARAAYNAERIKRLERELAEAKTLAQVKADEAAFDRDFADGEVRDSIEEIQRLMAERDSALAVIDMVNRSANAWAKGCDRAERTITRLKARIGRLKERLAAAKSIEADAAECVDTMASEYQQVANRIADALPKLIGRYGILTRASRCEGVKPSYFVTSDGTIPAIQDEVRKLGVMPLEQKREAA